jgi:DNA replication protein DnaC
MCEMPPKLQDKTFGNFKVSKENALAVGIARDLAEGEGPYKFLTLLGETDTGKSHLAAAICNRWLERKQPARYAYVPSLLDELRQGIEDKSYSYRFNLYCSIPLLVLDDLGLENSGRWVTERLTTLINTRLVNGLPLVVTANLPLDDLPGDEERRIGSRLAREPFCHVAVMRYTPH